MTVFMFATGIENSYPTIDQGRHRIDEMAKCDHYGRWREDFSLVREMGIDFLRYGPPLHRTHLGPGRYDWEFADITFAGLRALGITPIADLCHFGVPDWIGNFQNPDFPRLFAEYARAFAERYPWVQAYTPVNEMFVCASFSAAHGWWNEQLASDAAFVTAVKHIVLANVLAMQAIVQVRRDALFIQSESSQYFHAAHPDALAQAQALNERRFLALDLNYGRDVSATMYRYLMDGGMTPAEYDFFMRNHLRSHCIMGTDYYRTNEHMVARDGTTGAAGDMFGYTEIIREYYNRYGLPVMHTETNSLGGEADDAVRWLHREWSNVRRVRDNGLPILGFTWYSLTDQVDWGNLLREDAGRVDPVGLYDLDRKLRPVGRAYRQLISDWRDILPARSSGLALPLRCSMDASRGP